MRNWRLLILGAVLGGLVLGLHVYLGSIHVTQQVQQRLSRLLGLEIEVEQARIGLWEGSTVQGVAAQESIPLQDRSPFVQVRKAELDLTLWGILGGALPDSIDLTGASLHLRFADTGKLLTTLPKPGASGASLPTLHIHEGRITLDQQGREAFTLSGLEAKLQEKPEGYELDGTLADPQWGDWSVQGNYDRGQERLILRLTTPHTTVRQDMLRRLPFVSPNVWAAVEVNGTTGADITLRFPVGARPSYRVDLDVESADLRIPSIELRAHGVSGRTLIEDGVVQLQGLLGEYGGGQLETTARLDFSSPPSQLQFNIKADQVQIQQLPRSWNFPERLRGRVGMSADLIVRLEHPRTQTTGKGEGWIHEVVFGEDLAWPRPIGIRLTADGTRFQLHPMLPALIPRPGRLFPALP